MSSGFARFGRYLREVDISSAFRARTLGPRVFGCLAVAGITAVMGAGIALADDAINGVFAMDGADLSQVTVNTTCGPDGCSGTAQSNVGWIAPIALDHGVWLWHTALNINPGLLDLDLGPYKGPGALLAKHPLFHPDLTEWDPDARITRPKVKKRQNIRFPRGSSAFRNAGALVFESFVDETGQISLPIVDDRPPASTLIYTALEGVWRWKIEPAKADGKPVPCYYRLTVNYKPQRR